MSLHPQGAHPMSWAVFGGLLAMAGLPIYIHAPKVYADAYGIGLAALGGVLGLLRLVDFVQDPALGWLAQATARWRGAAVAVALSVMAGAMLGLFAVAPPVAPLLWFALMLTALFSAYSFLTISFYAQGVTKAETMGPRGHVRLAVWREGGMVVGVCLAAVAPAILLLGPLPPFAAFALLFAAAALLAGWLMRGEWHGGTRPSVPGLGAFGAVWQDPVARMLLIVALLNAAPVAVSSTLFLFFVESRLAAPGWEGPLLLLFFASAAVAVPLWARLAARIGEKRTLLGAMVLAVIAFSFAALLGPGDAPLFALVCIVSGAALGADLTLLSALFSRRMAQVTPDASAGFALWAFVTKATLALAALVVLPALDWAGFSGPGSDPGALAALGLTYALLPCFLKLAAIAVFASTDLEGDAVHA